MMPPPPTAPPLLTEDEYWRMFHAVRGDVEVAIKTNHAYLKIRNFAVADRAIFHRYQRDAHFWMLNTLSLQTTFFISFGRIFDHRRDSFSIHKVVDATIANPSFLSKAALLDRRRKLTRWARPRLARRLCGPGVGTDGPNVVPLRTALAPHYDRFKAIYQPIRHKYFAHPGMEDEYASRHCSAKRSSAMSPRFSVSCTR